MEQIFYVVWCHRPAAVGCGVSPSPGFTTEGFFCCQPQNLFPACGHRLRLFRICLRDKALKTQQTVFSRSPASSERQHIFVCEFI